MQEISPSQSNAAYRELEQKIVTLELRPGSLVTEKQLIDLTGLGRTPVREALQRLSWEGLIEIRPRSGVKITEIRPEDYLRVMEPRVALEPILARGVARFADDEHRGQLKTCATAMLEAAENKDVEGFLKADKAFDEVLDQACPNPFIAKILAPLQTHSRRFWFRFGAARGPEESARHHIRVMEAILARDESGAEAAMTELMHYLRKVATSFLS